MTMLHSELLQAIPNIRHGFFTRQGGVSEGIFASLNCGFGSGDDPERIAINRHWVAEALGAKEITTFYQVHSDTVVQITGPYKADAGAPADGGIARAPGLALGILTADCAPVLLADKEGRAVAAVHAGWKGAFGGILKNAVEAMVRGGVRCQDIRAAIGPCIGQNSYEVGPEFRQRFVERNPAYAQFFADSARPDHAQFDLSGFVEQILVGAGVEQVEKLVADTCLEEERFFSYRRATLRSEAQYGRQISAIMIAPN